MFTIKNCRLSFPHIFEASPESQAPGARLMFSATFLIPKDSDTAKAVKEEIKRVAETKWGAKASTMLPQLFSQDKVCLHDGNAKQYDGYADHYYVTSKDKVRPVIVDRDRTPLAEADGKPYAGCYVNALVDFWAQDNQYGKRINCVLKGVQFVRDGDAFTAGTVASTDDFEDLSAEHASKTESIDDFI